MSWFRRLALVGAALAMLPGTALADPLVVSFPTLGIETPTERVGLDDAGQLGTPTDPDAAGVYQLPGNLLLVGHVDWGGELRTFSNIRYFSGGEPIQLSDGRSYHVVWTKEWSIDADADVWPAVAAPTDGDVLTLLTCSGPFSQSRHLYLDRVAVRAIRDQ
jgi:hypothetical protein